MQNTTANATAHTDLAGDLRTMAEQRVTTCAMYVNRRALVRHNTVIVSSIHNSRGLQLGEPNADGGQATFLTVFPKGMPTCYTPQDAAQLVEEMNAHLAEQGSEERVRAVSARDWWQEELDAALRTIAFMDKHDVR